MYRLDPVAIEALREVGGDDFVAEPVQTLLADAPGLLAILHGSDVDDIRGAAHTAKSNATTFGATRLANFCLELEAQARAGNEMSSPVLAAAIEAEDALGAEELRV
jgi:histidine phosphotransfer protein HptB